ncbi:MAG: hypothetical protein C0505_08600 [Leptothrix sp. (in: Bacteria)]|nr:hypothetical protein [Leptothrix sp. (in: b-proteobacteria)]
MAFAPSPPIRRHRALPLEPFVFAAFLLALTLGINVVMTDSAGIDNTAQETQPAQPAQAALVTQVAAQH